MLQRFISHANPINKFKNFDKFNKLKIFEKFKKFVGLSLSITFMATLPGQNFGAQEAQAAEPAGKIQTAGPAATRDPRIHRPGPIWPTAAAP